MKTKRKEILLILTLLILSLSLFACSKDDSQTKNSSDDVPEEVTSFLADYFEASKEDPEEALEYRHWENETDKELSYANLQTILDYEISEAEKVNDDLYAFTILIEDSGTPEEMVEAGEYIAIYNFVANIDGVWYVCANQKDIPSDLQDGFDSSKYDYGDQVIGSFDGTEIIQPNTTQ